MTPSLPLHHEVVLQVGWESRGEALRPNTAAAKSEDVDCRPKLSYIEFGPTSSYMDTVHRATFQAIAFA
jgi:hypothetical protein